VNRVEKRAFSDTSWAPCVC